MVERLTVNQGTEVRFLHGSLFWWYSVIGARKLVKLKASEHNRVPPPLFALVAQLAEQAPLKGKVRGPTPRGCTTSYRGDVTVAWRSLKPLVWGQNPAPVPDLFADSVAVTQRALTSLS